MTAPAFTVQCRQPWLIARFPASCNMLSWSPNRPGFRVARTVAWLEVRNADLADVANPVALLRDRLRAEGLGRAVGLMTARDVRRHHRARAEVEGVVVDVLTTVGLTNGERIGCRCTDPTIPAHPGVGTVNTLVHVSVPLSRGGLVEAMSLATQARTIAVFEAGVVRDGVIVTGTGTDCIVVASPSLGQVEHHAGLHTAVGEAVGAAVLAATRDGVLGWLVDQRRGERG
jgi:adenosylcobinamide amidohydrolase